MKKISLYIMAALYVLAGINHFAHPHTYYVLIPPYLPFPILLNTISGVLEIALGTLLIFNATRKFAAIGIVILLVLFIPVHIYMIQKGGCMGGPTCTPLLLVWLRLFPGQFILIAWARWYANPKSTKDSDSFL